MSTKQLAQVKINDDRYLSRYLSLAKEYVISCTRGLLDKRERLLEDSCNVLKEIGWPEPYILDKFKADIKSIFLCNL